MARPNKQGVDYFPLDVHLDDKFKFIEIKFKLEGFALLVKLLQKIYSYGYWYKWSNDEALLFADETRVDIKLVNGVVDECLDREVFSKASYEKYGILTSRGIQKRYKEIVRRRKDVEVMAEYLLIDGNLGVNDDINPAECSHNDGKSTQRKVKETDNKKDIDDFFERVWILYPRKLGKGNVSDTQKKKLYNLGFDKLKACIDKFKKHMQKENRPEEKYPYGGSFFNSGYIDYLEKDKPAPVEPIDHKSRIVFLDRE